eukprot:CAMPEP_0169167538 /NCGR_PEP_ID=MMETSP1015-20121227/60528_1 /TAXON_ID=342587 /ORGANISM="Karlodinium micrum, Strain CCMP2283" /LENGTH=746 /DNA_ID=CAMNT_0009240261 /DNA_START=56 /DNA_END=2292 /DNA_ORIENTATION=-
MMHKGAAMAYGKMGGMDGYGGYGKMGGMDGYGKDGYGKDGYGKDGYGKGMDGYGKVGGFDGYGKGGGMDGYGKASSMDGYGRAGPMDGLGKGGKEKESSSQAVGKSAGREKDASSNANSVNPLTKVPYSKRFFELLQKRRGLPAWETREDWLSLTKKSPVVILTGEPGSGKTTQVPQILLDAGYHVQGGGFKTLAVCQPHGVAAVAAAQRVSEELDVPIGSFVSTDILLGLLKLLLVTRPELKVVLSSSTLQMPSLQQYFDQSPLLCMTARTFPVELHHLKEPEKDYDYVKAAIRTVMQIHRDESDGDVMVFLTSEDEIEFATKQLNKVCKEREYSEAGDLQIVPLHASLLPEQLSRIFMPVAPKIGPGRPSRKVILSTQIGETAMPIDSVIFVVDTGMQRQREYNPRNRIECSLVRPISKARALRRAAKASRKSHGKCFRLYTMSSVQEDLLGRDYPEMLRSDLCHVVLAMKRVGVENIVHFDFLDPPSPEALMRAIGLLNHIGCLDEKGNLTEIGEAVTRFPYMHPQLAKMLIESPKHRCSNEALSIAAMLTIPSVFTRPDRSDTGVTQARNRFAHLDGDHLTLLNVFHAYKQNVQDGIGPARFCTENCLNTRSMMSAELVRNRLKKTMEDLGLQLVSTDFKDKEYYPNIRRCLLSGFFTQVAHLEKKDEKSNLYFTLKDRQEVLLHHTTSLQHKPEWVVYNEHVLTSRGFLKTVTQVRPEWLLDLAPNYFDPVKLPESEARAA